MNNSEVLELRKRFKKTSNTITRISGCYVIGMERRIQTTIDTSFSDLDESEQFKYLDLFKKGLSGVIGKNLMNLPIKSAEDGSSKARTELLALKNSELKNKDMLDGFYRKVIDTYHSVGNYLILLIHDVYDVLNKTSDNIKLDESEETYTYILCLICPVNLAKPALSYHEDANIIGNRERDWVVDMPDIGFLYPSFNDRSTDVNEVLYYCKDPDEMHSEFIDGIIGCKEEKTIIEEKEMFNTIVEEVINDVPGFDTFEVVRSINSQLNDMIENKVFGDTPVINKEGMKDLFKGSGFAEEHMPVVEKKFEEVAGEDSEIRVDSVREKKNLDIKSDNMQIKVKTEAADMVEIRVIDGRKCLVIPMDSDVEVNGIVKRIVEELENS